MNERIKAAMDRYVEHHIMPGDFLYAVLTNNFVDAVCRADTENEKDLREIAKYVWNELPSKCWGSPEKVNAWINQRVLSD